MITRADFARSRLPLALLSIVTAVAQVAALTCGPTASIASAQACQPQVGMDTTDGPLTGATTLTGWAVDVNSPSGSGVDDVRLYRDAAPEDGGINLADATLGLDRPDVDAANGLTASGAGWSADVDFGDTPTGSYDIYVEAHTSCGWTSMVQTVAVEAAPVAQPVTPAAPPP